MYNAKIPCDFCSSVEIYLDCTFITISTHRYTLKTHGNQKGTNEGNKRYHITQKDHLCNPN